MIDTCIFALVPFECKVRRTQKPRTDVFFYLNLSSIKTIIITIISYFSDKVSAVFYVYDDYGHTVHKNLNHFNKWCLQETDTMESLSLSLRLAIYIVARF